MERVNSFSVGEILTSADMNAIEDNTIGIAQCPYLITGARYIDCSDGATLKIGGVMGVVLPGFPNDNLNSSGVEISYGPGGLSASTHYYLYATKTAGVLAVSHTTTAPDSNLITIGADKRYLGSFRTKSDASIYDFHMANGRYLFRSSKYSSALSLFLANGAGTSVTYALADLRPWIPPHCRLAILALGLTSNSSNQHAEFRTATDGFDHAIRLQHSLANSDVIYQVMDFVTGTAQDIYYKVSAGGSAEVVVLGWVE